MLSVRTEVRCARCGSHPGTCSPARATGPRPTCGTASTASRYVVSSSRRPQTIPLRPDPVEHTALFEQLDIATLYRLLRLRVDVFVVEQHCAYPELDGRDAEPDAAHLWLTDGDNSAPLGYLRVLTEPDGPPDRTGCCGARSSRCRIARS